jgi:hypothetical protein
VIQRTDGVPLFVEELIDGSYGTATDCHQAYHDDLNALQGLEQNSPDFLQTQAGRCVASDDPRLAK